MTVAFLATIFPPVRPVPAKPGKTRIKICTNTNHFTARRMASLWENLSTDQLTFIKDVSSTLVGITEYFLVLYCCTCITGKRKYGVIVFLGHKIIVQKYSVLLETL